MVKYLQENEQVLSLYYTDENLIKTEAVDHYLRVMFMPLIKKYFPQHYLIKSKSKQFQSYLDFHYQTHKYFLRFDIDQLYLRVPNYLIGPVLLQNFEKLCGCSAPKHMYRHLETGPDLWFSEKPWNTALPNEKDHLCLAVGIYLLGLCIRLFRWPFLCYHHEFIVLLRSTAEIDECLFFVLMELERLKLNVADGLLCSRDVDTCRFRFMDFEFTGTDHTSTPVKIPYLAKNGMPILLGQDKLI